MARRPVEESLISRSQGAGSQPILRPEYKVISDLNGGLNTSRPPDQLQDTESPDCQNIIYARTAIAPDFGVIKLGSKVYGNPLNTFTWTSLSNVVWDILATTKTIYTLNTTLIDWTPVPIATGNPTVTTAVAGTGANPSVHFTGAATWATGNLLAAQLDDGSWIIGPAGGTTSPVTIGSPLATGRTIVTPGTSVGPLLNFTSAGSLYPVAQLTSDGSVPTSGVADPVRNYFILTNGFDLPFTFNGAIVANLAGVSGVFQSARFVTRYQNVTVFAATVESGVFYTYRIRRSATGDSTNYSTLDAGFDDLSDTSDDIVALYIVGSYLVIPRRDTIMLASYYGNGQQVFWYVYALNNIGVLGFLASDITKIGSIIVDITGLYEYNGDYGVTDIGENVFYTMLSYTGNLNPATHDNVLVNYLTILDETWVTYTDVYNTYSNNLLRYNHKTNTWFFRKFGNGLFFANISEITYSNARSWQQLVGTNWLSKSRPWNARVNATNFPTVTMCGAADNQVYQYDYATTTDNGAAIPWYYTTKDYSFPEDWATIDGIAFYGQGILGLLEVSLDGGLTWKTLATNMVFGPTWKRLQVDCSYTSETMQVRFSGTDPSFKLSWFAFKTMKASER